MTGRAVILRGDARALLLPDESVDLIVTSPPYFALRSYKDGGEHIAAQIGAEATSTAYVDSLIECTREWLRVLKPAGSLWVNLGDKYVGGSSGSGPQGSTSMTGTKHNSARTANAGVKVQTSVHRKSLIGLPWRYALRCIDELGLILRAEVIWAKPNGLPESVIDRVRRSHETWFHFVKQHRYFSGIDYIREPTHRIGLTWDERKATGARTHAPDNGHMSGGPGMAAHPLGKLPGSVWSIPTQPLIVPAELGIDHFAAFPMEWPRRIILGWSPSGICTACGEGRCPVVSTNRAPVDYGLSERRATRQVNVTDGRITGGTKHSTLGHATLAREIIGEKCACPEPSAPTVPAVVLDPFGGTGTTALMASVLGRVGISVDMSADYCRLAVWRTTDDKQLAKAREKCATPTGVEGKPLTHGDHK